MTKTMIAAVAAGVMACAAQATVVEVTPGGEWTNPIGENYVLDLTIPPGSSAITTTVARDGDGSIELKGNRTRFVLGSLYPKTSDPKPDLFWLKEAAALTFDWRIAADSTNPYNVDYTPALRFTIFNGSERKELIWEGAYNGTYGNTLRDTWYTSKATDKFYITGGSVNDGQSIADWANELDGDWMVKGISVGHGGGNGTGYHAFVDNITVTRNIFARGGPAQFSTTYNFNVNPTAAPGAVPEPASWAMMVGGFGLLGGALRRRRTVVRFG